MLLLVDENVPASVAQFFADRGHEVHYVRDILPAGTPDPVIATLGDRMSAIVVTWDRDFESLVKRVPEGNRGRFRKLGRISFRCNEVRGREYLKPHPECRVSLWKRPGDFGRLSAWKTTSERRSTA